MMYYNSATCILYNVLYIYILYIYIIAGYGDGENEGDWDVA